MKNRVDGKVSNESGIYPEGMNVLLEMPQVQEKTAGGIILPDALKTTQQLLQRIGLVLGYGDDAFVNAFGDKRPLLYKIVGSYVFINLHSGTEIKVGDMVYRLVSSDEIRAGIDEQTYEILKSNYK